MFSFGVQHNHHDKNANALPTCSFGLVLPINIPFRIAAENRSWRRFGMGFEEVKGATLSAPLEAMSDMFMIAGDIHASLYSGSKAMHSHILHIFSEVSRSPDTL